MNTAGSTLADNASFVLSGSQITMELTSALGSDSTAPAAAGQNANFSTRFQFRMSDGNGLDPADGIAFLLAAKANGLGARGSGLGYNSATNRLAIAFDPLNSGAPTSLGDSATQPNSGNHVAADTDGALQS